MGNKKKKKKKKISAKKERYAKFHKEKAGTLDISMPDLTSEQRKEKQNADDKLSKHSRYNRNAPRLSIADKKRQERSGR